MLLATTVWIMTMVIREVKVVQGIDYNREEHGLLCDVLAAATRMWGRKGEKVSGALKESLKQTIFGKNRYGVEDPKSLNFPSEYHNHHDNYNHDRLNWCGACGKMHFPGESAPHDLLCLCTPGPDKVTNKIGDTLCGKNTNELGSPQPAPMGFGPTTEAVKKTWAEVVQICLKKGVGRGLKRSIELFKEKVEGNGNILGGRKENTQTLCGGNSMNNICVNYVGDGPGEEKCTHKETWWYKLYETIQKEPPDEEIDTKQKPKQYKNVKTRKLPENTTEAPKTKTITDTPQATSQESCTSITRAQWSLSVALLI